MHAFHVMGLYFSVLPLRMRGFHGPNEVPVRTVSLRLYHDRWMQGIWAHDALRENGSVSHLMHSLVSGHEWSSVAKADDGLRRFENNSENGNVTSATASNHEVLITKNTKSIPSVTSDENIWFYTEKALLIVNGAVSCSYPQRNSN